MLLNTTIFYFAYIIWLPCLSISAITYIKKITWILFLPPSIFMENHGAFFALLKKENLWHTGGNMIIMQPRMYEQFFFLENFFWYLK